MNPTHETDRLILRPPRLEDLGRWAEFPADPATFPTRALRPQPVPPTPAGLPTSDAVHPHTSPMRNGDEAEVELDYNLPPEPLNDWNP